MNWAVANVPKVLAQWACGSQGVKLYGLDWTDLGLNVIDGIRHVLGWSRGTVTGPVSGSMGFRGLQYVAVLGFIPMGLTCTSPMGLRCLLIMVNMGLYSGPSALSGALV